MNLIIVVMNITNGNDSDDMTIMMTTITNIYTYMSIGSYSQTSTVGN